VSYMDFDLVYDQLMMVTLNFADLVITKLYSNLIIILYFLKRLQSLIL
jgi:hypothetical protein